MLFNGLRKKQMLALENFTNAKLSVTITSSILIGLNTNVEFMVKSASIWTLFMLAL